MSPEQSLWCAVIAQAFEDMAGRGIGKYPGCPERKYQDQARRWLLYNRHEFLCVCLMAGLSASQVRRAARRSAALAR